jgi:hypothetical protein
LVCVIEGAVFEGAVAVVIVRLLKEVRRVNALDRAGIRRSGFSGRL